MFLKATKTWYQNTLELLPNNWMWRSIATPLQIQTFKSRHELGLWGIPHVKLCSKQTHTQSRFLGFCKSQSYQALDWGTRVGFRINGTQWKLLNPVQTCLISLWELSRWGFRVYRMRWKLLNPVPTCLTSLWELSRCGFRVYWTRWKLLNPVQTCPIS